MRTTMVATRVAMWRPTVIIVSIVVVVVIIRTQRAIIAAVVATSRLVLSVLRIVRVVLRLLACLLPFASLHSSFLEQSALLCKSAPFLPVLHLVLSDQGLRRTSEYIFILAELADPGLTGRIVEIGVLLLGATFASSVCVELGGAAPGLARWGGLLRRLRTLW